jgi:hypothetical protein
MALAPVDYGPQLQADNEGYNAARQEREAVLREVHQLGNIIEGGATAIVQGRLHTQALQATAAVKEQQAATLQFIDSNPYVQKTALQQKMSPEDYAAWHAGLGAEYKDAQAVPMYTAAGALFDSEAKKARDAAGQVISLPGWRNKWDATERTESSTIRERYVNRLAADQMIADQRAQTLMAVDKLVDGAVKPEDIAAAAKAAETSPWLKPAERRFAMEKALVAKDSFVARQAMLALDTGVMKAELSKLRADNAAELYPNMNVKQRLDLANQLGREYGFKAAKAAAEGIVGPNVDESGKVNRTAIAEKLAAYDGLDKEEVTKAVKIEEAAKLDIFGKKMAEVQQSILRKGQDPMTGRFSYAKAMQNADARKAAQQLNEDAPELLTALSKEEQRNENIDAKASALEQREARAAEIKASDDNLQAIHKSLDDPAQSDVWRKMTPAQFDVQLYNRAMTEPDRQKARTAFAAFQKNGGKPDERAETIVKSEIGAAAQGSKSRYDKILAAQGDKLRVAAHKFIRDNPTMKPDELSDALRAKLREELLAGSVIGGGSWFGDANGIRQIDWETNPKYRGKDFKTKSGVVIRAEDQRVTLTKDGQTMSFPAGSAAAARADGWK